MPVSVFELFRPGVGPSSSHTVGPMRIALRFVRDLQARGLLPRVDRVEADLYGSLALTGRGHATDRAVLMGLLGHDPATVDPEAAGEQVAQARASGRLPLAGRHPIGFDERRHLRFRVTEQLPQHPNAMRLAAFDAAGGPLLACTLFSIGGGFVADAQELAAGPAAGVAWPHPYRSAAELLARCGEQGLGIAQLALANELALRSRPEVEAGLDALRAAMFDCIDRGLAAGGVLPGALKVRRRAAELWRGLQQGPAPSRALAEMRCASAFAIAVNEENACGGRVVTAPTNGAAGIVPAVLRYYEEFCAGASRQGSRHFLLAAAAVGSLYKENASISGAEVGCQGEVGVASSMAAAGLAAALGGSAAQVENAAEIAMEHNLGLTCDPVAGLVQIPCIERNAMGSVKAINAAGLALSGDGEHHVSLDRVIETMRQTGADMSSKYKETALGGLAVNVVAC